MNTIGKDFFFPEGMPESHRAPYLAGGLCVLGALALRLQMLHEDGLWDSTADNEIRTQVQVLIEQIKNNMPEELKDK